MLTLGPLALQYLVIYSFFLFQDDDEDFLVENEEEVDVKELDVPKATSSKEYLGKLQYKVRFTLPPEMFGLFGICVWVVEFHDPTLGIGKVFGQESTVVK